MYGREGGIRIERPSRTKYFGLWDCSARCCRLSFTAMRPLQSTCLALVIGSLAITNADESKDWEQRTFGSERLASYYWNTHFDILTDPGIGSNVLVPPSYEPCNGFPEYCYLPIDWSVWLGAPSSGSSKIEKILTAKNGDWIDATDQVVSHFVRTQDRTVTSMLDDGNEFSCTMNF
jgi:hypothetical protein